MTQTPPANPHAHAGTHGHAKLREPLAEIAACCSLPQALETMGERWSFMILRASFNGLHHFEEFLEELGIARNILSNRLTRLVESGILKRAPCVDDRRKIEYRLTDKGLDLLPTMIALRQWGEKWESGVPSNPVLVDERDRRAIQPISILAHDGRMLTHHDLCWIDMADLNTGALDDDHEGVVKRIATI